MLSMARLSEALQVQQVPWRAASASSRRSLNVEFCLIDNVDDFAGLAVQWQALFAECAKPYQLFQSHAWLQHWCTAYRRSLLTGGQRLAVVVARQHGRVSLILPMAVARNAGVKTLQWMGLPASQYGDVIVKDPEVSRDLILAALAFAIRETGADMLWVRKVRDDAAISPALQQLGAKAVSESAAPFVDLSSCSTVDDHMRRLSSNARKQCRRRRRRLEEQGKVEFTWYGRGEAAAAAAVKAMRLKRETLGQASRLTAVDACLEDFFASVCRDGAGPVEPAVSVLTLDREPIAYEIGLVHGSYYVAHIGVYDPSLGQHSPGTLQIFETIAACIGQGIRTYDLLAPADNYKMSIANDVMRVCDYALAVSSIGTLYKRSVVDVGVPLLTQLRNQSVRLMRNRIQQS